MPTVIPLDDQQTLDSYTPAGSTSPQLIGNDSLDNPQPVQPRTLTQEFGRQLGLTARAGITGVTGTAGVVGDALNGLANLALPLKPNQKLGSASQAIQDLMTRAGLPVPETPIEKAVGWGASALAGAGDPILRVIQAGVNSIWNAPAKPVADNALVRTTKELIDQGVSLPPSRVQGSSTTSKVLEGFVGKSNMENALANRNNPLWPELARKALNLPEGTDLTAGQLKQLSEHWIDKGYKPIESLPSFGNFKGIGIGAQFRNDLSKIVRDFSGGDSFPQAGSDAVKAEVNKYLFDKNGRYLQSFSGEDAVRAIRNLRTEASSNFDSGNGILASAQRRIAKAMEDNIDLNLQSMPRFQNSNLLENFRAARTMLAKSNAVEDALVDRNTGVVSPQKMFQQQQNGVPLTGELETIAKAGSPQFGGATKVPAGQPIPSWHDSDWALRGAALGAFTGSPWGAAAGAGIGSMVPVARSATRNFLASQFMQNRLAKAAGSTPGYLMTPAGNRSIASSMLTLPLFTLGQR